MDVVKYVGKYLETPVGTLCYNTDKVLTTVLEKQNVEGLATIVLRLVEKSGTAMTKDQILLSYQWLEHINMYGNQAHSNPAFAKNFLQGLDRALERSTYLTGYYLTVTDIAAYHTVYPLIERLTISEQESLINVCRWFKHIQAQPGACGNRKPLPLNTLTLILLAPAVH